MPTADEIARRAAYMAQRASRITKRRELEDSLAGDPVAAAVVRGGFMPLVAATAQAQAPDPIDEPESIVANHNLNL